MAAEKKKKKKKQKNKYNKYIFVTKFIQSERVCTCQPVSDNLFQNQWPLSPTRSSCVLLISVLFGGLRESNKQRWALVEIRVGKLVVGLQVCMCAGASNGEVFVAELELGKEKE